MRPGLKERLKSSGKLKTVSATALGVVLVVAVAVAVFVSLRQRYTSTGLYRADYEGRILDKSATFRESETGSRVSRQLRIRGKDGEEFLVNVNEDLHERARVGMWVKSRGGTAELTPEEP